MTKSVLLFISFALITSLLQSCATVFGGRTNTLVFREESTPRAKVYLDNNYAGEAPGKIRLKKSEIQHGSKLEIKAEGFETAEYLILRRVSPLYSAVDIVTGALWLGIDFANGNIYRPFPRKFSYELIKIN